MICPLATEPEDGVSLVRWGRALVVGGALVAATPAGRDDDFVVADFVVEFVAVEFVAVLVGPTAVSAADEPPFLREQDVDTASAEMKTATLNTVVIPRSPSSARPSLPRVQPTAGVEIVEVEESVQHQRVAADGLPAIQWIVREEADVPSLEWRVDHHRPLPDTAPPPHPPPHHYVPFPAS